MGLQGARGDPACGRPAVGGATLRIIGLSRGVPVPLPAGDWSSSSGGPEHQPWNADETLITIENRDGGSPSPPSLDGSTYQPKSGSCSNYPLWDGLLASEPGARPRADQRHGRRSRAHRPAAAVDSRTARSAGPGSRLNPFDNDEDVIAGQDECRLSGQTVNGCPSDTSSWCARGTTRSSRSPVRATRPTRTTSPRAAWVARARRTSTTSRRTASASATR